MLVPFYPIAGRFKKEDDSRMEIDYNAAGVLLVEAEAGVRELPDTGEFAPDPRFQQVVPQINYSCDISSYPLLVLQVRLLVCFLHTYSACSSIKQPRFSIWLAVKFSILYNWYCFFRKLGQVFQLYLKLTYRFPEQTCLQNNMYKNLIACRSKNGWKAFHKRILIKIH